MTQGPDRKIVLADGEEYTGHSFGAEGEKILEIVFNTSMTGYQEILSDPSYTDQAVVMTYPLIGNYGMADDDFESGRLAPGALIVREHNEEPSGFRADRTLGDVMKEFGTLGISGVDTRKLTRHIRDRGSMLCIVTGTETDKMTALRRIEEYEVPEDAVSRVSCREPYEVGNSIGNLHAVVIDCGIKRNILRCLAERGIRITVVPYNTPDVYIRRLRPNGILVSNGPGDPNDVNETIRTVGNLIGEYPVFGICLGHQIISIASGASTYKLKFGHRGGNHPVKDLTTGRTEITSQNHSYAVDEKSLAGTPLTVSHLNLLDGTVEGVTGAGGILMGVQFHPESSPGPRDSMHLFDRFVRMMEENRIHA